MEPQRATPAVGAIIIRDEQILLVLRSREPYKDYWSVPGGRQEWGETLAEAVRRESKEETGLQVKVGKLAGAADIITREGETVVDHRIVLDYFADIESGELHPGSDAPRARWVPLRELRQKKVTPELVTLLESIKVI